MYAFIINTLNNKAFIQFNFNKKNEILFHFDSISTHKISFNLHKRG